MKLSIVTALYNQLQLTREFWTSLEAFPPDESWEIIWVDDGSTDGTRDWLATLSSPPHRVILNNTNQGYAVSNNLGAQAASGECLAFLNNDLVLTANWFAPMLAALQANPKAGVVGNVQFNLRTGGIDHTGIYYHARGRPTHYRYMPPSEETVRSVLAATAACMIITRELFHELHGFDEQFRNGCEDIDLCLRARAIGRQNLVALNSSVRHHISASPGRTTNNQRNVYLLMRRWSEIIPDLAAESWSEVSVRDVWESKLTGLHWIFARITRPWLRRSGQPFPRWLRRFVTNFVARELARGRRQFPSL